MNKEKNTPLIKHYGKTLLFFILVLSSYQVGFSQVANYDFLVSSATYTPITGGVLLATSTDNTSVGAIDDNIYNISNGSFPFGFNFSGIVYTGCNVSSNGFISFGTTAPSTNNYSPILSTDAYTGAISVWGNNTNGIFAPLATPSPVVSNIRWQVVGATPSREIVIQYTAMRLASSFSITNSCYIDYQIRLQETSNNIVIAYGTSTCFSGSTNIASTIQVGLRGASNTDFKHISSISWSNITLGTTNADAMALSTITPTANLPVNGLNLVFIPFLPCTTTPNAGKALPASLSVCEPTLLYLSGVTFASGFQYQWQSSITSATTGFTNVLTATADTYLAPIPTVSIWYKCVLTCPSGGVSATSAVSALRPFTSIVFPYRENFDNLLGIAGVYAPTPLLAPTNGALPCGWTVQNTNSDNFAWRSLASNTLSSSKSNVLAYNTNIAAAADDWAFTPAMTFTAGKTYQVYFNYRVSTGFTEKLEVKSGNSATIVAMTNTVFTNSAITNNTYITAAGATITPTTTGTYHFGLHVFTNANQGQLLIDNFQVVEITTCTTPIAIFPYNENFDAVVGVSTEQVYSPTPISTPINGGLPCGWVVANANNDATSWKNSSMPTVASSLPNTLSYTASPTAGANDWVFSPPLTFTLGKTYKVSFDYRALTTGFTERLEVRYGTTATVAGMPVVNSIFTDATMANTTYIAANVTTITPTVTGTYYIGFRAYSIANQGNILIDNFKVEENCPTVFTPLAGALPSGQVGVVYTAVNITQTNLTSPTFSAVGLPSGLSISATGSIIGTPLVGGANNVVVTAISGTCSASVNYTLNVTCPTISFTAIPVPATTSVSGINYSYTVVQSGLSAPIFSATGLPSTLSISASGLISGVPTVGVYNINVTATQGTCSNSINYTLTVTCPTISFTAIPVPATTSVSGVNYSYTVVQSGLSAPVFSATGLPATLNISASGLISGVPTVGVSNITVTATQGSCSNSISYTLTITCPTISFTAILISATTSVSGTNYSYTVVQSGLSAPVFSATGLPATLSISSGGLISGIPAVGVYNINVTATQGSCLNSISYTLNVTCPTISFTAIPIMAITSISGANYSYTVVQSGLTIPIFTATGLPATLSISSGGLISGIPTVGVYNINVTATQGTCLNSISYTLNVTQNPATSIDNSFSNAIKISPNPSNGDFSVDFSGLSVAKSLVCVYDAQGKTVFSSNVNNNNNNNLMNISLKNAPNGIYLLQINTEKGNILKRIVKAD